MLNVSLDCCFWARSQYMPKMCSCKNSRANLNNLLSCGCSFLFYMYLFTVNQCTCIFFNGFQYFPAFLSTCQNISAIKSMKIAKIKIQTLRLTCRLLAAVCLPLWPGGSWSACTSVQTGKNLYFFFNYYPC